MIITCNNCNKKFNIDSNLIPDRGRLLQCSSCDHKWFFKNEVLENTMNPIVKDIYNVSVDFLDQNKPSYNDEINPSNIQKEVAEVDTEEEISKEIEINSEEESDKITEVNKEVNKDENTVVNTKPKKQKKFKILNVIIVAIISFVAFIIIVDTFKYPIGQFVPNIEIILYNLYESIKDISLFISDLT